MSFQSILRTRGSSDMKQRRMSSARFSVVSSGGIFPKLRQNSFLSRACKFLIRVRVVLAKSSELTSAAMRFHSFRAETQQLCDLTYFVALADQFQDFKFTIAESLDGVDLALRPPMCEFCDHLRRHGWAEIGTSAKNFPDRNYHVVERF